MLPSFASLPSCRRLVVADSGRDGSPLDNMAGANQADNDGVGNASTAATGVATVGVARSRPTISTRLDPMTSQPPFQPMNG